LTPARASPSTASPARVATADDVLTHIDGTLLVDLWPELVLPRNLRAAWTPIINEALAN
jgi:hypothetical protein